MPNTREKLIDIVETYADFLDWDTKDDIVDSIMELIATDNNVGHKWIPVTERLPEKGQKVVACGPEGGLFLARVNYCAGRTIIVDMDRAVKRKATHWMPLPEPPKGE